MNRQQNDPTQNYQRMKQTFEDTKDKVLTRALETLGETKQIVKETGDVLDDHNERLDHLNNKLEHVERKAQKANRKIKNYLDRASNCQIYIALAIQLFIFILLMSL